MTYSDLWLRMKRAKTRAKIPRTHTPMMANVVLFSPSNMATQQVRHWQLPINYVAAYCRPCLQALALPLASHPRCIPTPSLAQSLPVARPLETPVENGEQDCTIQGQEGRRTASSSLAPRQRRTTRLQAASSTSRCPANWAADTSVTR